jgi:N-acetylglutamate synthase-like GNAT family acetyltransferase
MLSADVTLRPAAATDWSAIAALLRDNKLPLEGAQENLPSFFVATKDGIAIGCAGVEVYGDIALLRSVAVMPRFQRKGVGSLLLTRLFQEATGRGIGKLYLLTETAADYFTQMGFRRESIERAPAALKASAEFQGACPASATFMVLILAP